MNISNTVDRYFLVKKTFLKLVSKKKLICLKFYMKTRSIIIKIMEDPSINFIFCNLIFNILKKKKLFSIIPQNLKI